MVPITVFTPTYNRAYILDKCYQSLRNQTCKRFMWLIIDDGSTDGTAQLVQEWMDRDNGFEIRYIYKENGGLHTGYNKAIELMQTELSVCIDSDDSMPCDAIERILSIWEARKDYSIAGIVGLDYSDSGELIGKLLPEEDGINAASLLCVPGMGDKKYVVRNDLLRQVAPMPTYSGERNFNPHYFIIKLSQKYLFKPVNQCFCLVDYQENGMSANIYKQYISSPQSFAELRRVLLITPGLTIAYRFKTAVHYVSSCIFAKERRFINKSPAKVMTVLATPFGILLSIYIKLKVH